MNINEIVKAKWLDLDDTDCAEVDAFILAIMETEEYSNDVINGMDFNVAEILHGLVTDDPDYVQHCLKDFKSDIRSNALDVYQNAMLDLCEQAEDAKDAHGDYLHDLQVQARIDNE